MFTLNLVRNIALLITLSLVYQVIMGTSRKPAGTGAKLAAGVLFGLISMAGMITPVSLSPGLFFDGRSIMLCIAGLFGGPLPASVAAIMSAAFRYRTGGSGMIMGILVIIESAALGSAYHVMRKKYRKMDSIAGVFALGFIVHLVMVLLMLTIRDGSGLEVMKKIALPVLLIYPPATVMTAVVFFNQEKKLLAEEALAESEKKYRDYIEYSPYGILVTDRKGFYTEVNRKACEITGYERDELTGRHLTELLLPERVKAGEEHFRNVFEKGKYYGEFPFKKKDGSARFFSVDAVTLDNEKAIGFIQDITERIETSGKLRYRLSVERIISAFSSGLASHDVYNLDDEINTALSSLGGVTKVDRVYLFMYENDLKHYSNTHEWCAEGVRELKASLQRIPSSSFEWWTAEMTNNRPVVCSNIEELPVEAEKEKMELAGQGVISLAVVPVFHEGELTGFIGFDSVFRAKIWTDEDIDLLRLAGNILCGAITREKEKREKENLSQQLIQSQKLESIGRLAGGVAHDFNNLLQVIIGFSEMAKEECPESAPEEVKKYLAEIIKAANRSAELTSHLLAFARRQTVRPVPTDINDAVNSTIKMLNRLIGENMELVWLPGGGIWEIMIDRTQLNQVLTNLTVNARDAVGLKEGGRIIIETANISADENFKTSHPLFEQGDYVMLSVSDNGCGMDRETQARIFEPFFTTKGKEGTGLGLSTVYGIVNQNHGFINLYSEPGEGTTMKLFFRKASGAMGTGAPEPLNIFINDTGSYTILLVEDENSILMLARDILSKAGYNVITAGTGEQAIASAEKYSGKIDMLLTDVVLQGMNGKQLSEALIKLKPEIKTLYMSGYTANVIAHRGILDDGITFLQKPFSGRELIDKVAQVLSRGQEGRESGGNANA